MDSGMDCQPDTLGRLGGLVEVGLGRRNKRKCLPATRYADAPCDPRSSATNACANRRRLDGSFARPIGALRGMQ
jgi:hypothetical protein